MEYLRLGASLYVPSVRADLTAIANGRRFASLRSVIFCTEDSLVEADLPTAMKNLEAMLRALEPSDSLLRFIRVRNPQVLETCLSMNGIEKLDGFVLPKITRQNIPKYWSLFVPEDPYSVMITLETPDAFDNLEMIKLRNLLLEDRYRQRILSIRIGGNDLLNLLSIRRTALQTIYTTPLSHTIPMLVSVFKPYGFNLTGPVFEALHSLETLRQEVSMDIQYGLFGKTTIHPDHISVIEENYRVSFEDVEMAEAVLSEHSPAVFAMHGYMCEPTTHVNWARLIIERARLFGMITGGADSMWRRRNCA